MKAKPTTPSSALPSLSLGTPRTAKTPYFPKTRPHFRPYHFEGPAKATKRTLSVEQTPSKPLHFRVVGTVKPKFRRDLLSSPKERTKTLSVRQRDIAIERRLRRLGTTLHIFTGLALQLKLKLRHPRSLSEQFLSVCDVPPRSHSELRIKLLSHVLTVPVPKPASPKVSFKPSAVVRLQSTIVTSADSLGVKITDASYSSLLFSCLELVLKLAGDVKCEHYYAPKTRTITSSFSGDDAPLSECCASAVTVQFTELYGCKVVCLKHSCLSNTLKNFVLPLPLRQQLWMTRPLLQEPMSPRQVSLSIAAGKYRSLSFRNRRRSTAVPTGSPELTERRMLFKGEGTARIFTNERLKRMSQAQQPFPKAPPSNMLLLPRRELEIASSPLHVMLVRQKALFTPLARPGRTKL
jgi:hypothetical protein